MSSHERHGSHRPRSERRPSKQLLGEQELRGMISNSLTELGAELQAGKSERLLQYLDFAARFHHYSRANQFLIVHQRPDATRVASYKMWQELGYQVAKGETGIRILAPSIKKQKDEESDEERRVVTGFVAVSVFDVAQLTPEKRPPEFFEPLEGDQQALCEAIVTAATADGFQVETEETGSAQGYSSGRRIVTQEGLDSTSRALTLLHEWAHGVLHQGGHALAQERHLTVNSRSAMRRRPHGLSLATLAYQVHTPLTIFCTGGRLLTSSEKSLTLSAQHQAISSRRFMGSCPTETTITDTTTT